MQCVYFPQTSLEAMLDAPISTGALGAAILQQLYGAPELLCQHSPCSRCCTELTQETARCQHTQPACIFVCFTPVPSSAGRCPCSGSLPAGHSLRCCASSVQVRAAASQLLLLLEVGLLLGGGVLVLLVLADQVVHVGLRLCELHLVHALTCTAQRSVTRLN